MNDHLIHPAAECFPMMAGAAFDELVADIKAHGQRETIKVFNRQILDGRNRLAACVAAGVPPTFEDVAPDDPIAFVISANIHRRQLTTAQRAAIAADLANIENTDFRGNQWTPSNDGAQKISTKKAAAMMNVSPSTVERAKKVKRENPEAHDAAKRGEKRLAKKVTELRDIKKESAARRQKNAHIDRTDPAWISQDLGIHTLSTLHTLARDLRKAKDMNTRIYIAEHERAAIVRDLSTISDFIQEAIN